MRAVPLVSGCVELEMNLVEPANKVDGQAGTIFLLGQSADKTLWQTHLEEATLATARTVVEPTLEQTEITRHLVSGPEQEIGKWIGADWFLGRAQQRHNVHVSGCTPAKTHRN